MIQYKTNVLWDSTLCALEFIEDDAITRHAGIAGLCQFAIKFTTGVPAATPGKFIPAAQIQNAFDATWYENSGSVASPVWTLVGAGAGGITQLTNDVTAGPGSGVQAATVVKLQGKDLDATTVGSPVADAVLMYDGTVKEYEARLVGKDLTLDATTGQFTVVGIQGNPVTAGTPSVGDVYAWSGTAWVAAAVTNSALPSADIFVGNAGNVATAVPMTGDISIDNTGLTTYLGQKVFVSQITLNGSQIATLNGSPLPVVTALAAGLTSTQVIMPIKATMAYTFNTSAFATNTELDLIHSTSSVALMKTDIGQGSSTFVNFTDNGSVVAGNQYVANEDLNVFVKTGNPTGGVPGSKIKVTVFWTVMDVI